MDKIIDYLPLVADGVIVAIGFLLVFGLLFGVRIKITPKDGCDKRLRLRIR